MKPIEVFSTKYDGSFRDSYPSFLLKESADFFLCYTAASPLSLVSSKEPQDGLIEIYFKHKWFNVWHICEQITHTNLMYINLAMPPKLKRNRLEWVDLDLDYRVHLDGHSELLDEAEFEKNKITINYPDDLIKKVSAACKEIELSLMTKVFPFNHTEQVQRYKQLKPT